MYSQLYGSLTIAATTPVKPFPIFENPKTKSGAHTESKYRGTWSTLSIGDPVSERIVALPQRNKYMTVSTLSERETEATAATALIAEGLTDLDSRFDGARQLYKVHRLMEEIKPQLEGIPYVAIVNNTADHASFNLLSSELLLRVYGVFDVVNRSVRLVWTTDADFVEDVRATDPIRYVFYRFPDLYDRPMFVYTQNVCAKWYSWATAFTGVDGLLKVFNALENFLYKDHTVETLNKRG